MHGDRSSSSPRRRLRGPGRSLPGGAAAPGALLLVVAVLAACGGGHRLAEFDFRDHTLAVVDLGTPAPVLMTGDVDVEDRDDPLGAVLGAGSRVAKEIEARKARARLDSAAAGVDLGARMSGRLLKRAARYLAAAPVEGSERGDYVLEVDVSTFGIDARGEDDADLFVEAEAILLSGETGEEIWSTEVRGRDRLTPSLGDTDPVPGDVVTAGALSRLSVRDFRRVLEGLADLSSDAVANQLREDLREARRERRER